MPIKFTPECLQKLADLAAEMVQEQSLSGIDANGRSFPPGVTLVRSGDLLRGLRGRVVGGVPQVVSEVDYAEHVNRRFEFAGIAPQYMPEFERRAQPIIADGSYFEE